jgi:hypothetical protein
VAAFSMTIDPDGAMHDWVDLPDGWRLLRIPTQEAIHLLGPAGYQAVLVEVCARERPDVLVTHPPYDWLTPSVAARIRASGTRLVGYAFDDEIFATQYGMNVHSALREAYDRYVTTREVRWATAPLPQLRTPAEDEPRHEVVLVGRAYPRRVALVERLRSAGVEVVTRGEGWPGGFASRAEMLDLYAHAAIVLTTADWESREVPMVKHRLLDTAMLGAFQVAQAAPDLRRYFSDDEVPSWRDADELIAQVRTALADPARRRRSAEAARRRALAEHTWTTRWAELLDGVRLPDEPLALRPPDGTAEQRNERSFLFDQLLVALASRAEADGRIAAAAALWRERLARDPGAHEGAGDPAAMAGLGRCLRDLDERAEAIEWLRRAARAETPICAGAIHAALPSFGAGVGLGRLGLLPPNAEPTILLVAALVEVERVDEACAVLDEIRAPALARAVVATLSFSERPELAPLRQALEALSRR